MDENFDQYVQTVATLVTSRESYQRSLGQTASTVVSMYGNEALVRLADEVAETSGVKISTTTLRNYKWVWEKTSILNLPDDLSYRCLQAIAGSKDPEKYAKLVEEGLSSNEIIKMIREEKGLLPKHKTFLCKQCGAPNEV
jgi:hypothetical protein